MSNTYAPVAPVQSDWWNVDATLAAVLAKLRLGTTDIDENRLRALVPAAGYKINAYLDLTVAPSAVGAHTEALQDALEQLVIAMYGPPIQNFDSFRSTGQSSFVDPIETVAGLLDPKKERWGFA